MNATVIGARHVFGISAGFPSLVDVVLQYPVCLQGINEISSPAKLPPLKLAAIVSPVNLPPGAEDPHH